jgi:SAM-dependent methyltransferase
MKNYTAQLFSENTENGNHTATCSTIDSLIDVCSLIVRGVKSRNLEMEDDENGNPLEGFWMEGDSLAPPCQAELDVIDVILQLVPLNNESKLFDLGCGDGRICIEASKRYGCQSCGVEIEAKLFEQFQKNIISNNLSSLTSAVLGDLRELDLSTATVIVIYLLPDAIEEIKSKLEEAVRNGATLICNTWGPKGWKFIEKKLCGYLNNVDLFVYNIDSLTRS